MIQQTNLSLLGVGYVLSPYVEECVDQYPSNCANPGIDVAALYLILSAAGIDLKLKKVSEDETWEMLANGSADIGFMSEVANLPELTDFMDQTTSASSDRPAFIVKKKMELDPIRTWSLSKSFHYHVWIVSLLLVFLPYQLHVIMRFCNQKCYHNLTDGTEVGSGSPKEFAKYSSTSNLAKCVSIAWLSIQIGIYGGSLSISVSSRELHTTLPFTDFDGLSRQVLRNQCKVYTFEHIVDEYGQIFPLGNDSVISETEQRIKMAFELYPPIVVNYTLESDLKLVDEFLESEACMTIVDYESRGHYWTLFSDKLHAVVDPETSGRDYVYFFRRGLPFQVKNLIQAAFQGGSNIDLYAKITNRDLVSRSTSLNIKPRISDQEMVFLSEAMTMWDLKDAFIVLAIGNSAAAVLFLTELLLKVSYRVKIRW